MLDRFRSALPLVSFVFLAACASSTSSEEGTVAPTAEDPPQKAADPNVPTSSGQGEWVSDPSVVRPVEQAAASAPSAVELSVDGQACEILSTGMISDGPAWTVGAQAKCRDAVTLKISGRFDVRYPQNDPVPFRDQQAVIMDLLSGDGHATSETFSTATEGSGFVVVNGPTIGAHAPVEGKATLVERGVAHELRFKLHY